MTVAMESENPLRVHLIRALDWEEAHVGFEKAVAGIPDEKRGLRIVGFEHSLWELLEHMRIAQEDLVDFCLNANYVHSRKWPDDYWPQNPAPPDAAAWKKSVAALMTDRNKLKQLVQDPDVDLLALVPTGTGGQTYLRTILLVIDHNAYHLGQLLAVRQSLGVWP
jgi:uncharacterized damage-inducible protein DinB